MNVDKADIQKLVVVQMACCIFRKVGDTLPTNLTKLYREILKSLDDHDAKETSAGIDAMLNTGKEATLNTGKE